MPDYGLSCEYSLPLHPPSEADASKSMDAVAAWISTWRLVAWPDEFAERIEVEWQYRNWRLLGTQTLPVRVRVTGSDCLAMLASAEAEADWRHSVAAAKQLKQAWPKREQELSSALSAITIELPKLDSAEIDRLVAVVNWVVEHPGSGMLPRQLPIEGVDSKWLEGHRAIVQKLVLALSANSDLGLAAAPAQFTIRVLDQKLLVQREGHLRTFSAPVSELDRLTWKPEWVLIVENLQTLLALPPLPGLIAVFGRGRDVTTLAGVSWISQSENLLYWGDLDSHGLQILSLARKVFSQLESILMDSETLSRYSSMAVIEPKPFRGSIGYLTEPELAVLSQLRQSDLRLEQERIDITYAAKVIEQRITTPRNDL